MLIARLHAGVIASKPAESVKLLVLNVTSRRSIVARPKRYRIPIAGYALLTLPATAFGLGCWQVKRLKWKNGLIAELEKQTEMDPVDLPKDLSELLTMNYRRVRVRGTFLHDKEMLLCPRQRVLNSQHQSTGSLGSTSANTGAQVLTPFKLENSPVTVLINRGWVPKKYYNPETRAAAQVEGVVDISGVYRNGEKRPRFVGKIRPEVGLWPYRDVDMMAKKLDTAPIYIEVDNASYIKGGPLGGQTVVTMRNEHLQYIFTWYALTIFTAGMWFSKFIRRTY